MPFIPHTPESLIPRSDSRNPATTCKGITASGRPCRRSIGAPKASRDNGVLAVVSVASDSDDDDTGAAAYFCWQHNDQAEQLAAATPAQGQDTRLYPLQERTSIDTLVARLGVLEVEDPAPQQQPQRPKKRRDSRRGERDPNRPRRVNRPPTWDRVQGPLMSVPSDIMESEKRRSSRRQDGSGPQPRKKKPGFWVSLCCMTAAPDDDDYVEVVRHKRRVQNKESVTEQYTSEPQMPQYPSKAHHSPARQSREGNNPTYQTPPRQSRVENQPHQRPPATSNIPPTTRRPLGEKPSKPLNKTVQSETSTLLSLIPKTLPPQTASSLLAELSKPISPHDDPGYIYIFWLTSETSGPAPTSTASTLLTPPSRPDQGRRTSDILRQYSVRTPQRTTIETPTEKNTILLKIGRASNVHRRMNEWTRQCGYALSLVRFYPYVSSSPSPSSHTLPHRRVSDTNTVRKVPHVHRVERLIHIELGEQRVKRDCEACGKEHREWFEVEASREGVRGVDEVVRRWVGWAEGLGARD